MISTALLSLCLPAASAAEVELSGAALHGIMEPDAPKAEGGPRPWVVSREIVLTDLEDAVRVHGSWKLTTVEPGWVDLSVVDASMRVDGATLGGAPVSLKSLNDGSRHLVTWIDGPTELEVEGEVVAELRRGLNLFLLPAPIGSVQVKTSDAVVKMSVGNQEVVRLDDRFWTGYGSFQVSSSVEQPAPKTDRLAVGTVGMGVTVGDGALQVATRMRWSVVRGELDRVVFTVSGAGSDLVVEGATLAEWSRSGDTITAVLREAQREAVALEARWTVALSDSDELSLGFPTVELGEVFRTERVVQIARDGDREIVSGFSGWEAVPAAELPAIASDLVLGTPVSAWRASGAAPALSLLRFKPVSGPATIVDVAAYDGVLSRDGRLLMRAHYSVRNDRGAFLRVAAPPDSVIIGARVGGEPVHISRDGDTWLVPLLKSVETVQGLLSFPVDLVILADGDAFSKKDERSIPLPVVDAAVAVSRVTLTLPVGWRSRLELGEEETVADFTEGQGLTYGFAAGDSTVATADALFQEAVGAWMKNDFDQAQSALDQLHAIGASNENINRLESNLDLVLGGDDDGDSGGQAVALQRRVKEQAQARAAKDVGRQEVLLEEAEEAYLSGEYDKAEEAYAEALDIGVTLERIQQKESVEQSYSNAALRGKLESTRSKKKSKGPAKGVFLAGGELPIGDVQEQQARQAAVRRAEQMAREEVALEARRAAEAERKVVLDEMAIQIEEEREAAPVVSSVELAPGRRRVRGPAIGGKKAKAAAPQAPPPPLVDTKTISTGSGAVAGLLPAAEPEAFAPLEVTASTLDVVIPTYGQTTRYQHLLLPAGQAYSVVVRARRVREKRR